MQIALEKVRVNVKNLDSRDGVSKDGDSRAKCISFINLSLNYSATFSTIDFESFDVVKLYESLKFSLDRAEYLRSKLLFGGFT